MIERFFEIRVEVPREVIDDLEASYKDDFFDKEIFLIDQKRVRQALAAVGVIEPQDWTRVTFVEEKEKPLKEIHDTKRKIKVTETKGKDGPILSEANGFFKVSFQNRN